MRLYIIIILSCVLMVMTNNRGVAQDNTLSLEQEAISALSFLVGRWAGPGISYDQAGNETRYYDTEYVRFDLDRGILLINARGETNGKTTYQLHTVIYYDQEVGHYWYVPFTNRGSRRLKGQLADGKFVCMNDQGDYRLTFQRLDNGKWNEFGERKFDGQWQKIFETILSSVDDSE